MGVVKETAKWVIARAFSPRMQHRIRRYHLARQVVSRTGFREPEIDVLASLIGVGDSTVDIGANVGAYTNELSSLVGTSGHVYSFEPVAANYDILQTVVERGRMPNVTTFLMALGSKKEERNIAIPSLGGFTGYYWAHLAEAGDTGAMERVQVETLDNLRAEGRLPRADFIKCDVEGGELEVLRGAAHVIAADHPGWLIEVSRATSTAVFALLTAAGYRAFVYDGKLNKTDAYRDKEFSNYFFLCPESVSWRHLKSSALSSGLLS
jgi:FkbM family methyltransferase